jgi:hypothetical protein
VPTEAAPALLAGTTGVVAPTPITNKALVLPLVWLIVPLAEVAALLALVVLLVGLTALVMPLAALLAPVVPLVGLIALVMPPGTLVMPLGALGIVCALATPGRPSKSAVTTGMTLIAFMQHSCPAERQRKRKEFSDFSFTTRRRSADPSFASARRWNSAAT